MPQTIDTVVTQRTVAWSLTGSYVLVAAWLSGCGLLDSRMSTPVIPPPAPQATPTRSTALTEDAVLALRQAEQAIAEARHGRALWLNAVETLDKARAAAAQFDSEAVRRLAGEVIALCSKSLIQRTQPPVTW